MRRCTFCFRFHPGSPPFCSHCGRSFNVRICPRGHVSARGVTFCSECGSSDLSMPAPPASVLHHLSGTVLYLFAVFITIVFVLTLVLAILKSIDWQALSGPLLALLLMLGILYWSTTLLPGPIKKVGKAAGKRLLNGQKKRH